MNNDLSHLLATRRWCYTIVEPQNPKEHGGYVPSLVIEGISGHRPMSGDARDMRAAWVWGKTPEEAKAVCRKYNQSRGIDEETETRIVLSTLPCLKTIE